MLHDVRVHRGRLTSIVSNAFHDVRIFHDVHFDTSSHYTSHHPNVRIALLTKCYLPSKIQLPPTTLITTDAYAIGDNAVVIVDAVAVVIDATVDAAATSVDDVAAI